MARIAAVGCRPGILHADAQPGHEVGGLARPLRESFEVQLRAAHEYLAIRPEPDPGAGQRLGDPADPPQARAWREGRVRPGPAELTRDPAPEAGRPFVALPSHLDLQPARQRVHDRCANAVQAARGRVGAAAEFAACVQPRHHELDPGQPGLRLDVDGDTTPVVFDLGGMIGVQDDVDAGAATGKCLIDGIVDYLPQAVQQPPAVGGSDVHAGALAHRLKPFKHGQMARCVAVGTDFGHRLGADGGH